MVEKLKATWYEWIPGWLPVCLCILSACWWVSSTVTGMQRDIQSLQKQVESIEDYLRHNHERTGYLGPNSGLQLPENPVTSGVGDSGFKEQ